jgi:hypothetical protein
MSRDRRRGGRTAAALALALTALLPVRPAAHEIPADVRIQAFVKPEGDRLHLLVRVPLGAMRDVNFPADADGFLDIARADPALRTAALLWIANEVEVFEDGGRVGAGRLVGARVSLPSDRSFGSYDEALAHLTGARLPADARLPWQQGLLDVLFDYPIRSEHSRFSLRLGLERLGVRVSTVLRFVAPGGAVRAFEYAGNPGVVQLDPRWHQAALRFVELGFFHILDGVDHLLFLLCLIVPFRRLRPLVLIVTSFTVAHSITLIASAFDLAPDALWFPPLIETLIATSIVYMALENILGVTGIRHRWAITFAFGLVHGFGFSFALRETLQFAGSHLLTSLLAFNVGVELGQVLVLLLAVPALQALFKLVAAERAATIVLSALVAHTAWHWMTERWAVLRAYQWPAADAATLAGVLRWITLAVIAAALVWLFGVLRRRLEEKGRMGEQET